MSFKTKLEQYLIKHGQASYDTLVKFAELHNTKTETLVRTCRLSPLIHPIKNAKGHITGYSTSSKMPPSKDTCPHCKVWLNHSINCPTKAQLTNQGQLL